MTKLIKFIKRFGLLIFGMLLTLTYYNNIGVSSDISSWGVIFIFLGILIAVRRPNPGVTSFGSVNGTGTALYGKREVEPDGSYIATQWFIFFLLPVFPLGSYRVLPDAPKMEGITQVTTYQRFEKVALNKKQVLNTYLLIYGFIFILFVLPIIIFF